MNKKYKFLILFFLVKYVLSHFFREFFFLALICEPVLSKTFLCFFPAYIKQGWYHKTSCYSGTIVCFC